MFEAGKRVGVSLLAISWSEIVGGHVSIAELWGQKLECHFLHPFRCDFFLWFTKTVFIEISLHSSIYSPWTFCTFLFYLLSVRYPIFQELSFLLFSVCSFITIVFQLILCAYSANEWGMEIVIFEISFWRFFFPLSFRVCSFCEAICIGSLSTIKADPTSPLPKVFKQGVVLKIVGFWLSR